MEKVREKVAEIGREAKRVAKEDPRRVVHSLKVGLALASVSSFYYYQPLYDSFGVNAMWAVMTVVVVFEFSVGATLGKGLNRGAATLLAGALGVGAHHLASLSGQTGEPILLAIFVFLQAAVSTFVRFFPAIKARYDYGLLIFILTFSLISVSGFRDDEILELAHKRLSTVIVGGAVCVIISIFVCPVWAGPDLHNLIANNLEKLGDFLEGFGDEYLRETEEGDSKDVDKKTTNLEGYKSVLNSKSNEEALANFARWEPRHGGFRFRHPWKQYLALGALIRQCAYRIDALNSYLKADIQVSTDIKKRVEESFRVMSSESAKEMKELSLAIKTMTKPSSSSDVHVKSSQSAAKMLTGLLKSGIFKDIEPSELTPVAAVASLLSDIVDLTGKISESVHELASTARFKNEIQPTVSPEKSNTSSDHVVVTITRDDKTEPTDKSKNNKLMQEISITETVSEDGKCEDKGTKCPHVAIRVDESIHGKHENEDLHIDSCVSNVNTNDSEDVNNGSNKKNIAN